jgi:hypothetical protein
MLQILTDHWLRLLLIQRRDEQMASMWRCSIQRSATRFLDDPVGGWGIT